MGITFLLRVLCPWFSTHMSRYGSHPDPAIWEEVWVWAVGKLMPFLETGGQGWGSEMPSGQKQQPRGNKGRAGSAVRLLMGKVSW